MSDDRIEQIHEMVTQLVRIVGNTNAMIEEMRTDINELKIGQQKLEADVAELKVRADRMETKISRLDTKLDKVIQEQAHQSEVINVLASRSIHHEAEIQSIKRAQ